MSESKIQGKRIKELEEQGYYVIKLKLTRIAPSGTEDTSDVRLIAGSTEVKFS